MLASRDRSGYVAQAQSDRTIYVARADERIDTLVSLVIRRAARSSRSPCTSRRRRLLRLLLPVPPGDREDAVRAVKAHRKHPATEAIPPGAGPAVIQPKPVSAIHLVGSRERHR